ncbi:MAG: serine/threonine protein kinase [Sulfuritalea sp.]|nr:serine/threonine protein kinase [Sulfuritalea sp.]MDP1982696.1 serine/threonine protein kinase [Sulfuritalea sp.]
MNLSIDRVRPALLLLLVALLGVGAWAYRSVGESVREMRAIGMQTLLDTQIEALRQWIAEGRHEAEQLAADAELSAAIARLAGARGGAAGGGVIETVLRSAGSIGVTAVHVIDIQGGILASSDAGRAGRIVTPDFLAHLAPALGGRSVFVRPYRGGAVATGATQLGRVWVAAPVRNAKGKVIAVLALGSPADAGFARLFKAARPGASGESFAFDAEGWLVTESRHGEELRGKGRVAEPAGSVLALRLAVPEVGVAADTDAALTRLAAAAVAARHLDEAQRVGVLSDPYPGYLGREVIGAWRWLAELDLGAAVEMDAAEAYAPLRYLQIAFMVLLVPILLVWLSFFVPPEAIDRLLRRKPGQQIGPYRVVRQIGAGAISNVYLAEHRLLKRPVALKVLKPQTSTDEWIARFQREVQSTSLLRHPNTITIHDYGTGPNGLFYYAMEYLEGLSLADLVERYGPAPPSRTAYILRQACASLWEAHSCGLVHRDIKPQNIMLCEISGERDVVKVLDFGLVKQVSSVQTRDLTGSLRILGTPLYMSPERIRNPADADARADIYALGAVGFYLLTGKRLFETETEHDLTYHVLHEVPRLASDCSPFAVPAELDALIGRCLEKDTAARPQTIAEVAGALDALLVHAPWTRRQIDAWWEQNWVAADSPERRFSATRY